MDTISLRSLRKQKADLESKHAMLLAKIEEKFTNEVYRELNVVRYRLEVCEQRLHGKWKRSDIDVVIAGNLKF